MDLDSISLTHVKELEQATIQLIKTMKSAKLNHHATYLLLQKLEHDLGDERCNRYDGTTSEFTGY